MSKARRGVLGYKQDPRQQILFSFKARDGEEWPSDSSDDDYEPDYKGGTRSIYTEDDTHTKASKKRKTNKEQSEKLSERVKSESANIKKGEKKKSSERKQNEEHGCYVDCWSQMIPIEILHIIFKMVADTAGAVPFLCRAAKTCRLWNEASLLPSLWKSVDLSFGWIKHRESTLSILSQPRFSQLQHLSLAGWPNLSHGGVKVLSNCSHLVSLSLSGCKKLSSTMVKVILVACPHLTKIDLSNTETDAVSVASLKNIVDFTSGELCLLNVSRNTLWGLSSNIFYQIMVKCPKIVLLDISNCQLRSELILDIEKLQCACPHLKILRLANTLFRATAVASQTHQNTSPGFCELEELSIAMATTINNQVLKRLLKSSYKLSLLDVRWCCRLSAQALKDIPCNELKRLFISHCTPGSLQLSELAPALQKWQNSLQELDISWNKSSSADIAAIADVLCVSPRQIQVIDLSGTAVEEDTVRKLLKHCKSLECIDLTSCRWLPRGMKDKYTADVLRRLTENVV